MAMARSELSVARSTLVSSIVALFLESVSFGALLVVYGITAWVLLLRPRSQGRTRRDLLYFAACTVMFILPLVHIALDVHIDLRVFLSEDRDFLTMAYALDVLNGLVDPIGAVKFAIYVTQTLIGDGFMIYRAYIVWNRNWLIVIAPSVLLSAEVVLGYVTSFIAKVGANSQQVTACVNAFFVLSVATNVASTVLIMKRILWSQHSAQECRTRGSQLRSMRWRVVESLIQSAAIYSIASISLAVTSFLSQDIGFPACHSVFPSIIGLVFALIVIRISLNTGGQDVHRPQALRHSVAGGASSVTLPGTFIDVGPQRFQPHAMRSPTIAIQVSVSTTSDSASEMPTYRTSSSTVLDPDSPSVLENKEDVEEMNSDLESSYTTPTSGVLHITTVEQDNFSREYLNHNV